MSNYVGQNIPRNDGWDKVTGNGIFTHDVKMPGMLYTAVLRSTYAHAKIISIDTSKAGALPGVWFPFTVGSTASTPFDIGSHASRTLYTVGHLLTKAGKSLKEDILNWTADFINNNRSYIEASSKINSIRMIERGWAIVEPNSLDMNEGIISGENIKILISAIAYEAHIRGKQFVESKCDTPPNSPPWHAHAAEVEVDMETGMDCIENRSGS